MIMSTKEHVAWKTCLNHQLINQIIIFNTKLLIKTHHTLFISIINKKITRTIYRFF